MDICAHTHAHTSPSPSVLYAMPYLEPSIGELRFDSNPKSTIEW